MEPWRIIWRDGFAPSLSTRGLNALRDGLRNDDPRLRQGVTTFPEARPRHLDYPCEGSCALGFAAWQGDDRASVGQVAEFFDLCCWEADDRLGQPAACRDFLNWHDDTPRDEMRADLLAEVELELSHRVPPLEPSCQLSSFSCQPEPSRGFASEMQPAF
jgi:hypothetical protein